jgi:hypothetical protein
MGGVMWVYDAAESYIAKEFLNDMGRTSKCLKKKSRNQKYLQYTIPYLWKLIYGHICLFALK